MKEKIYFVKIFTKNPKHGNLAGVVPDALNLSENKMQKISQMIGASETAFIFPSEKADFKIRWFTPNKEVGLCVHATIGAIGVLKELGLIKKKELKIETKNAVLKVKVIKGKIFLLISEYPILKNKVQKGLLLKYLGIKNNELLGEPKTIQILKEDRELIIQVIDLKILKNLKPSKILYANLCKILKITGISIFAKETFDKKNDLHTREFAPLYGYLEDPLCGMAAGAIYKYLNIKSKITKVEQGNFLKTPGVIEIIKNKDGLLIGGNYVISRVKMLK